MFEGQTRAEQTADDVGHRHGQSQVPPNVAFPSEQNQGRQIRRRVDEFGAGAGVQKIKAHPAHKEKHQKTAGAGAKKAIVKTDHTPQERRRPLLLTPRKTRLVLTSQRFLGQGVHQEHHQHHRQDAAQPFGRDLGHTPSTEHRTGKGRGRCGQERVPRHLHAVRVLPCGGGGAPDGRAFVHAEQRGRCGRGINREQGGQQDEAAAAHDRIDETGEQRRHRNQ